MSIKEDLDDSECLQLLRLCSEVHLQCRTCIAILQTFKTSSFTPWSSGTSEVLASLQKLHSLLNTEFTTTLKSLYAIVGNYDFKEIRANGLRSFLLITSRCLASILTFLRGLTVTSGWSRSNGNILVAYINCFGELHTCLNLLKNMPRFCTPGSLFPRSELVGLPKVGSCSGSTYTSPAPAQTYTNFTTSNEFLEFQNLQTRSDHIKQEYFYGHCVAFYFCPTAQRILLLLTSLMAGYGSSYLASRQGLSNLVNTVIRSVTSYLSPEDRGSMVAKLTRDSNVEFCKKFWSFAEHRVVAEGPNVILPSMAVAHVFELAPKPLHVQMIPEEIASTSKPSEDILQKTKSGATVKISYPVAHFGPAPLEVRLLSHRVRSGMEWAQPNFFTSIFQSARRASRASGSSLNKLDAQTAATRKSSDSSFELGWTSSSPGVSKNSTEPTSPSFTAPKFEQDGSVKDLSPYLLFHIHGGGFVALNSQAQDIFLRTWAEFLDCPIFSINYSLAPEAPYPRALEECFFAYCWAALNREKLGCAPDARIVLCGDSAGGNLVLGVCMRIIQSRILPRPNGALIAYAPIVISFCPTPARMLSLADPLLPIGILSKCLMAYAGFDENRVGLSSVRPSGKAPFSSRHNRRHSALSSTMWNRFVPTFWSSSDGDESASGDPKESVRHKKLSSMYRDSTSMPSGLSELHSLPETQSGSVHRASSNAAFPFKSSEMNGEIDVSPSNSKDHTPNSPLSTTRSQSQLGFDDSSREARTDSRTSFSKSATHLMFNGMVRAPKSDLDRVRELRFPQDCFISPYLASDELFRQLPPMGIACSTFDPFLDDCLELAKRATNLGVPIDLRVFEDLPHAFLNFTPFGPEFQHANQVCMRMVKRLFEQEVNSTSIPAQSDATTT